MPALVAGKLEPLDPFVRRKMGREAMGKKRAKAFAKLTFGWPLAIPLDAVGATTSTLSAAIYSKMFQGSLMKTRIVLAFLCAGTFTEAHAATTYGQADAYAEGFGQAANFSEIGKPAPILGSVSYIGIYGGSGITTLDIQASPAPFVSLSAVASSPNSAPNTSTLAAAYGNGYQSYTVSFSGPTATVPVFVSANGFLNMTALSPGGMSMSGEISLSVVGQSGTPIFDQLSIQYGSNSLYQGAYQQIGNVSVSGSLADGFLGSINESSIYEFQTGTVYTVQTYVSAYAATVAENDPTDGVFIAGGSEVINALVDPSFTIAAADPSLYSVNIEQGYGNAIVTAVPEPSTWAMMILGLGALGFAGHRRSRKTSMTLNGAVA